MNRTLDWVKKPEPPKEEMVVVAFRVAKEKRIQLYKKMKRDGI